MRAGARRRREEHRRNAYPVVLLGALVSKISDGVRRQVGRSPAPVVNAWRGNWQHVIPFLAFPGEVRRVIYATKDRGAQPSTAEG